MTRPTRVRRIGDVLLVAGFLVALALPLADGLVGLEPAPRIEEKRQLAPPPVLRWSARALTALPKRFEAYWDDRFGFRRTLIRWHSIAKVALGASPSPNVLVGKGGWLFLAGDYGLEYHRAGQLLTARELAAWQHELEARHDRLAAHGIAYVFVVAPNKDTIYPGFMPAAVTRVGSATRLDQIVAHLRTHSRVRIVDVRGPMRDASGRHRLYHRTDTHWNDLGAFTAYRAIVADLAERVPGVRAPALDEFEIRAREGPGGDLATMLGLDDRIREERLELAPRRPRLARAVEWQPNGGGYWRLLATEHPDASRPRAVVFHDSFTVGLVPFLSEHFSRTVYMPALGSIDPPLIARERPRVVIQELVERYLMVPLPETPPRAPHADQTGTIIQRPADASSRPRPTTALPAPPWSPRTAQP